MGAAEKLAVAPPAPAEELARLVGSPEWEEHHAASMIRARVEIDPRGTPTGLKLNTRQCVSAAKGVMWLVDKGLASEWPRVEPEQPENHRSRRPAKRRRQSFKDRLKGVAPAGERRLVTRRMSHVTGRPVSWLWPGRFPLGRICFLLGRQGRGKSTFVHWLAATVANGLAFPDCRELCPKGSVIVLTAEENAAEDIKYRYQAMGLDDSNVHVVEGVGCGDESSGGESLATFALMRDVELLWQKVEEIGDVKLIVIDPIGSYTHGINQRDDSEVRALLDQLILLADEKGVCVLMVLHPSKNDEKDILDRAGNSAAFTQVPRMGWYLSDDPKDRSRRLLSPLKWNTRGANKTAMAVSFRKERLTWHPKPIHLDAFEVDRMLQKIARDEKMFGKRGPDAAGARKAKEFILAFLTEKGPSWVSVVLDQAEQSGIRESSFRKGLRRLVEDDGSVERFTGEADRHLWIKLVAKPAEAETSPPAEAEGSGEVIP